MKGNVVEGEGRVGGGELERVQMYVKSRVAAIRNVLNRSETGRDGLKREMNSLD